LKPSRTAGYGCLPQVKRADPFTAVLHGLPSTLKALGKSATARAQ